MLQWFVNALHIVWLAAFIYLYNLSGRHKLDYDTVSVALTCLEIILVVGGVFGFTYFRYIAQDQAQRTAELEARRATGEYLKSQGIDWQKLAVLAPVESDDTGTQSFADALTDGEQDKDNGPT